MTITLNHAVKASTMDLVREWTVRVARFTLFFHEQRPSIWHQESILSLWYLVIIGPNDHTKERASHFPSMGSDDPPPSPPRPLGVENVKIGKILLKIRGPSTTLFRALWTT